MDHSPRGVVSPNLPHSFEHTAVPPPWSAQAEADFEVSALAGKEGRAILAKPQSCLL